MRRHKASFLWSDLSWVCFLGLLQNWQLSWLCTIWVFTDSFNHSLKSVVLIPGTLTPTHLVLVSIFTGIAVLVAAILLFDIVFKRQYLIGYQLAMMCVKVHLQDFTPREFSKYRVKPGILIFYKFSKHPNVTGLTLERMSCPVKGHNSLQMDCSRSFLSRSKTDWIPFHFNKEVRQN